MLRQGLSAGLAEYASLAAIMRRSCKHKNLGPGISPGLLRFIGKAIENPTLGVFNVFWYRGSGSNRRPEAYESSALTN